MTAHRSNAFATSTSALESSVLPLADRAQRVASMLDRWDAEDVADEPEWDVGDLEPLALRPVSRP